MCEDRGVVIGRAEVMRGSEHTEVRGEVRLSDTGRVGQLLALEELASGKL